MIKVSDNNNEHNNAIFENHEYLLAYEYMAMLADRQNNTGCQIVVIDKYGHVLSSIIN